MAPQDIRPADPQRALSFYSGHYTFGDESVSTGGESPFLATAPSKEWFARLHTFRWLRHIRASGTDLSHANGRALINDWIEIWGNQLSSPAWRADIVACRLIACFCHAPILIKNAQPADYKSLLKSLARQTRYLHHNLPHMRDGYPRLQAAIALSFASICFVGREKTIKPAARDLDRELSRQILADGGHISRNPVILLEILADLLSLKQAYKKQGQSPSSVLITSIDKMMGAIRFFRHSNGDLAQFNGTGFTPAPLLTTILRYDDAKGSSLKSAPHSGYERLHAEKTVILMDTGIPANRATARRSMAGTLSFELSSGSNRFITNCGVPESSFSLYAPYVRATAAHSTVTINDTSSSRFAGESKLHKLLPSPLIRAPGTVEVDRQDGSGFQSVTASHDGYKRPFSLIHKREIQLLENGDVVNGCDHFLSAPSMKRQNHTAAIRFHLTPEISASLLSSGQSILMAAPNNDAWTLTCIDCPIALEESIRFSGPGVPRKSEQIVIYANTAEHENIRWVMERRRKKNNPRTRNRPHEHDRTPDLLDTLTQSHVGQ